MSDRRFKIGTFNLLNLALADQPYYNHRYSRDDYEKKAAWLGGQLERMGADVVGFQEVFHSDALRNVLEASGIYPQADMLVAGGSSDNGPSVALASRFPIVNYEVIRNFPEKAHLEVDDLRIPLTDFSRPVIKARVEIRPELKVTFFVIHLKSKRPMVKEGVDPHDPIERALGHARSLIRRAAEAAALRYLVVQEMQGTNQPVVIMGDFNDGSGSVTNYIISGTPPWRSLNRSQKQRTWDVLLYNVKDIQARRSYGDVYYTHLHNGHYESLDHIMVSQEFVRENPNRLGQVEYVHNFNDHLIDDTLSDERIPRWQTDHGQVVVQIQLRDESR